jgi:hypothetical protein
VAKYTPAEAAAEAASRVSAFKATEKDRPAATRRTGTRTRTLAQIIAALQKAAKAKDRPWITVAEQPGLLPRLVRSRLASIVPPTWMQLLPHLPVALVADFGDDDRREFFIARPAWNAWRSSPGDDRSANERPSRKDLVLATTSFGDWYSIRMSADNTPVSSEVSFWDHETTIATASWPSIEAFAEHIVTLIEHAVADDLK